MFYCDTDRDAGPIIALMAAIDLASERRCAVHAISSSKSFRIISCCSLVAACGSSGSVNPAPGSGSTDAGGSGGAVGGSAGGTGGPSSGGVGVSGGSSGMGGAGGVVGNGGLGGAPASGGGLGNGGGASGGTSGTGGLSTGGGAGSGGAGSKFPPITDPTMNGPFPTNGTAGKAEGPDCEIHRPATLGENGRRHPVILWGMGTGGFNTYQGAFDLWASNGFIVAAGLLGNGQGSGQEMLGCLEYVCTTYAPNIDCTRVGASGHSQGGGGALMTGQDPRVIVTAPVMPYITQGFGGFDTASITKQTGPMLLLSGTMDTIAVPAQHQQPIFDTTNVPVFWANLVGGNHVTTGIDGIASYKVIVLEWFRIQLMGDDSFRGKFYGPSCDYCGDTAWQVQRKGIQ